MRETPALPVGGLPGVADADLEARLRHAQSDSVERPRRRRGKSAAGAARVGGEVVGLDAAAVRPEDRRTTLEREVQDEPRLRRRAVGIVVVVARRGVRLREEADRRPTPPAGHAPSGRSRTASKRTVPVRPAMSKGWLTRTSCRRSSANRHRAPTGRPRRGRRSAGSGLGPRAGCRRVTARRGIGQRRIVCRSNRHCGCRSRRWAW